MGRRQQDEGLLGELFEMLLTLSRQHPAVGVVCAVGFAAAGLYLARINSTVLYGLGGLLGGLLYLLAALFLTVAAVGFFTGWIQRRQRQVRLAAQNSLEDLRHMNWRQFEQMVADLFRRQGWRVEETGAAAAAEGRGDGGVDLILRDSSGLAHLVQCKHYGQWKVGAPTVREFYGAMAAHQTRCEGIVVTCGRFTDEARAFAAGKPLRLIDGEELLGMIRQTNPVAPAIAHYTAPAAPPAPVAAPLCPACGVPMARRMARKGPRVGEAFWGCINYPRCKQVVDAVTSQRG